MCHNYGVRLFFTSIPDEEFLHTLFAYYVESLHDFFITQRRKVRRVW
jgi:hypothetical protein